MTTFLGTTRVPAVRQCQEIPTTRFLRRFEHPFDTTSVADIFAALAGREARHQSGAASIGVVFLPPRVTEHEAKFRRARLVIARTTIIVSEVDGDIPARIIKGFPAASEFR